MLKNVSGQKIRFFAFDYSTGAPKTGDSANLTAYVAKDRGSLTALTDTSATEISSTNQAGVYEFDLTQAETNCDLSDYSCKSSTSNVVLTPILNVQMMPANMPTFSIDSNGRIDVIKVAGTTQTARDLGASVVVGSISNGAITNAAFDTTAGTFRALGIVDSGTLQSATSGTAVLRAAASFGTDDLANAFVTISGGTGVGQSRVITAWNNTTKTATVSPAWTTTPDGTSTYDVFASPAAPSSSASTIAAAVWDLATSGHTTSGTFGAAMSAAGAAGDPWATALPGAYGSGTAGNIIGNRLDAAITSRMASYTQPTGFLAATFPGTVASTTNITGGTITTVTNLTNAPTAGDLTATMKASVTTAATAATPAAASVTGAVGSVTGLTASDVAAIKAKTDNLPASPAAVGSAMTLTSGERNAIADAAFLRQLAESYRSNGAAPTLAQALCEILAHLTEASISGTNKTTKRFDHSTTATVSTLTLDGDGNATDITRSS